MARSVAQWTFPAYRHLLWLNEGVRHPTKGDRRRIHPLSLAALDDTGNQVGLVLGCVPISTDESRAQLPNNPELLSLYVTQGARRQGIGRLLLQKLEEVVQSAGQREIVTTFMTGSSGSAAFNRLLVQCGWSAPEISMHIYKGAITEFTNMPWFMKYRAPHLEFILWNEIKASDLKSLEHPNEEQWSSAGEFSPWNFDLEGIDKTNSVGVFYRGEWVGWVLNHRIDRRTLRITCAYVRHDFARLGRMMPALSKSISTAIDHGIERMTFAVARENVGMVRLTQRWMEPWISEVVKTKVSRKRL